MCVLRMTLVSVQQSKLNPNALLFIPAYVLQVEDFYYQANAHKWSGVGEETRLWVNLHLSCGSFGRLIGEIPIITLTDLPSTCFVQSWLGAYSGKLEKTNSPTSYHSNNEKLTVCEYFNQGNDAPMLMFVDTTQSPEAEATLGNLWNITQVAASIGQALNMSAEERH
ncbi:hypothetical protein Tco_0789610 [Tanacetum coccineum]